MTTACTGAAGRAVSKVKVVRSDPVTEIRLEQLQAQLGSTQMGNPRLDLAATGRRGALHPTRPSMPHEPRGGDR